MERWGHGWGDLLMGKLLVAVKGQLWEMMLSGAPMELRKDLMTLVVRLERRSGTPWADVKVCPKPEQLKVPRTDGLC